MTLHAFLTKHVCPAGSTQLQTHTAFSLGSRPRTLHIKDSKALRRELYSHVGKAISLSLGANSVTEKVRANSKFRLFFDVDFNYSKVSEFLKTGNIDDLISELRKIPACVEEIVNNLTGTPATEMILATRIPYKLHIHFPNVIVTGKEAKRVCALLKEQLASHPLYDDTVIDESVYHTGLRMLYCHKGGMGKALKLKQEQEEHEKMFGKDSWSAVYEVTDKKTWEKQERSMESLEKTSIVADEDVELTPLFFEKAPPMQLVSREIRQKVASTGDNNTEEVTFSVNVRVPLSDISRNAGEPLNWTALEPILTTLGFKDIRRKAKRDSGFNFEADRSCNCVVCNARVHENHEWFIMRVVPQLFVVKSYSEQCHGKLVGWDQSKTLKNIVAMPDVDADYAELFSNAFRNVLFWTLTKPTFMHYNGNTWKALPLEQMKQCLLQTLMGVMERMIYVFNEQRRHLDLMGDASKDTKKAAEASYKSAVAGLRYVKKDRNLRGIIELVKAQLCHPDFEAQLDKKGHLLGMENGVIDLIGHEPRFRPGEPEDMISLSTGYDYIDRTHPTWNAETMRDVTSFIERIFPVSEELEVVQRYAGYLLLGVHSEKIFAVHTDERSGNNGKSKFSLLLISAMGREYAMDGGNNALLYKADVHHGTVDSHTAGMLAYELKRVVIMEEVTDTRSMDNELMKKLHGGGAMFEGRQFRSDKRTQFPWITKMILNCNNRKFPKFDWSDQALLDRLITVYHRSKFYVDKEQFEKHKHENYTFHATDMDDNIQGEWRPYMLQWMLQGFRNYRKLRFSVVPKQCKEWKKQLVSQQDTVTPWFEDNLVMTGVETDYVTKRGLYDIFRQLPEEKHKRTAIGEAAFFEHMISKMGVPEDRKTIGGSKPRNVWIGWRVEQTDGPAGPV